MQENKKYYIPLMCISKEDLLAHFEDKENYEELKKEINELDDVDMQNIANEMTDFMMSSYWLALEEAFCKVIVEK